MYYTHIFSILLHSISISSCSYFTYCTSLHKQYQSDLTFIPFYWMMVPAFFPFSLVSFLFFGLPRQIPPDCILWFLFLPFFLLLFLCFLVIINDTSNCYESCLPCFKQLQQSIKLAFYQRHDHGKFFFIFRTIGAPQYWPSNCYNKSFCSL